jgi:hypothetical protein
VLDSVENRLRKSDLLGTGRSHFGMVGELLIIDDVSSNIPQKWKRFQHYFYQRLVTSIVIDAPSLDVMVTVEGGSWV